MSIILGIETSCDETAVAIVENGTNVLLNDVSSQIEIHREYGGVVPEIASRKHVEIISWLVDSALKRCPVSLDAVAYTNGPGLMGALMVGASFAKAFAYARNLPAIPVHHIEGHIFSAAIDSTEPLFPCLILVVSGGHTQLIHAPQAHTYEILGSTRDDAVGESFDKVARLLGLPYPGGPSIQKIAVDGDPKAFQFPRAFSGKDTLDFSFSGLKTAVMYCLKKNPEANPADIAASFQAAAIDSLISRTKLALKCTAAPRLAVVGGVAANQLLRNKLNETINVPVYLPPMSLCTDNAAMIASVGHSILNIGKEFSLSTTPNPNYRL